MPATQPQVSSITLAQYEALPEDKRVEVFDGVIYDMASPLQAHQTISMELSTLINTYIKKKKSSCRVFTAPFDVKLSDHPLTIVQPDIMVICDKNKLDGKRCNGAPDFIIAFYGYYSHLSFSQIICIILSEFIISFIYFFIKEGFISLSGISSIGIQMSSSPTSVFFLQTAALSS